MNDTRDLEEILDNAPVVFGLRNQGHLPTIERMLDERKNWKQIGAAIGWDPLTAAEHYTRELLIEKEVAKDAIKMLQADRDEQAAMVKINLATIARRKAVHERLLEAAQHLSTAVSACTLIHGESATMDVELANVKLKEVLAKP